MAAFFVGTQFPSFKPIRATGAKVLPLVIAAIPNATGKDLDYLNAVKAIAEADADKVIYFTIAQAKLAGIID